MKKIKEYEEMTKLDLDDAERLWVEERADRLTDSFSELQKIDTDGILPLVTVLDLHNVLREDKAEKLVSREELLSNAPEQYDGYFQAPKTLD